MATPDEIAGKESDSSLEIVSSRNIVNYVKLLEFLGCYATFSEKYQRYDEK